MRKIVQLTLLPIAYILLSSVSAQAAVVHGALDDITGISWLDVGGVFYDVQFVDTSGSSAYNGAYSDVPTSNVANIAFIDALNEANATGVNGNFSQVSWDDGFGIAKLNQYVNISYTSTSDAWHISKVSTSLPFPNQTWAKITLSSTPPPVPVPATVWLFGSGLLGLVGVARRKKS